DAETERKMGARPRAIDDEFVWSLDRLFIAVARDVPHDDLVALLDGLAAQLEILKSGAPHMRKRRLPANHFGNEAVEQRRILSQLSVLVGMLVQRIDAARHGVAGGVVATDNQKDEVAEKVSWVQVPRGLIMRHHRQQVVFRLSVDALVPELREILRAFQQFRLALIFGGDQALGSR